MSDIYCLSNFRDYSPAIREPIKHSNRIKYTCSDISENYIVLGATSGSLYLFNRAGKFLHLIPNKHGAVTHVAVSANEKYVAFATKAAFAYICVYVMNCSHQASPQIVATHLGNQNLSVTALHWTADEKQFYFGDSGGQVSLVMLSYFISHSLLNISVHPILYLDSPIVQIDDFESLLLVSSCSKCILCNTEYEEYKQIGNKPRDGQFGACFSIAPTVDSHQHQQASRIYCARPGSRVWEADVDGNVVQTHQFKVALAAPPTKIYKSTSSSLDYGDIEENARSYEYDINNKNANNFDNITKYGDCGGNDEILEYQPQNLQFRKIIMIDKTTTGGGGSGNNFLLTYTELGLYIFDMNTTSLVLWCNQFERISDCIVIGREIVIFTQTGNLYSVQLRALQSLACSLVAQKKLLECAYLMKRHVKYFADKACENYEMAVLENVKQCLIDRHQYDLLNDLSVIFDALTQNEGNADNNSSNDSGSLGDRDRQMNQNVEIQNNYIPFALSASQQQQQQQKQSIAQHEQQRLPKEVYVLENSFCDSLKSQSSHSKMHDTNFKDALLTVTGKFGKNFIKYKFNIMGDERQKFVNELIAPNERSLPFKDVRAIYETGHSDEDNIVCRPTVNADAYKATGNRENTSSSLSSSYVHITTEEKSIYNLFLICKSAKFGNTNFVERYRSLFDEYSANELIGVLHRLEQIMQEHGDSELQAKRNCYEMYFNYLSPDIIWEMDDEARDYTADGFKIINAAIVETDMNRCEHCNFPLRFKTSCLYRDLGVALLRYYWSRNEQLKCFDLLSEVPALLDVLARFYVTENNFEKVLPLVISYGQPQLLEDIGKHFTYSLWARSFELFTEFLQGRLHCPNCLGVTLMIAHIETHFFYTWSCFLDIAFDHLKTEEILQLICQCSTYIPNDSIDREFFTRCMLKG